MIKTKNPKPAKRILPKAGRKMTATEAREHVNRKFGAALAKLAK